MTVRFGENFEKDLKNLKKDYPKYATKVLELIVVITKLPKNSLDGIGHPEKLKGSLEGTFSRRISQKHRLIYFYDDSETTVVLTGCSGHYDDK